MQCCQSAPGRLSDADIGLPMHGLTWEDAGRCDNSFDADTQQGADPFAAEEQELLSSAPLDAMLALQLLQHQFPAKAQVSDGAMLAPFASSRGSLIIWISEACVTMCEVDLQTFMQATCEAFMLRSQVYSLVRDQTEADKQLDELQ